MNIKLITFDWGDTLAQNHNNAYVFHINKSLKYLQEKLSKDYKFPENWTKETHKAIYKLWTNSGNIKLYPNHKELDPWKPILEQIQKVGIKTIEEIQTVINKSFEIFTDSLQAYDCSLPILKKLKEAGYKTGILSHVPWPPEACEAWFIKKGWAKYIDIYSFSSGVGWIKPHPKHYQDAIDKAGVQASEVLHIGDHPLRDITGAKEFGFKTCLKLIEKIYSEEDIKNCNPDYTITHVSELEKILGL